VGRTVKESEMAARMKLTLNGLAYLYDHPKEMATRNQLFFPSRAEEKDSAINKVWVGNKQWQRVVAQRLVDEGILKLLKEDGQHRYVIADEQYVGLILDQEEDLGGKELGWFLNPNEVMVPQALRLRREQRQASQVPVEDKVEMEGIKAIEALLYSDNPEGSQQSLDEISDKIGKLQRAFDEYVKASKGRGRENVKKLQDVADILEIHASRLSSIEKTLTDGIQVSLVSKDGHTLNTIREGIDSLREELRDVAGEFKEVVGAIQEARAWISIGTEVATKLKKETHTVKNRTEDKTDEE
jgi:hypothetical protein